MAGGDNEKAKRSSDGIRPEDPKTQAQNAFLDSWA